MRRAVDFFKLCREVDHQLGTFGQSGFLPEFAGNSYPFKAGIRADYPFESERGGRGGRVGKRVCK